MGSTGRYEQNAPTYFCNIGVSLLNQHSIWSSRVWDSTKMLRIQSAINSTSRSNYTRFPYYIGEQVYRMHIRDIDFRTI